MVISWYSLRWSKSLCFCSISSRSRLSCFWWTSLWFSICSSNVLCRIQNKFRNASCFLIQCIRTSYVQSQQSVGRNRLPIILHADDNCEKGDIDQFEMVKVSIGCCLSLGSLYKHIGFYSFIEHLSTFCILDSSLSLSI